NGSVFSRFLCTENKLEPTNNQLKKAVICVENHRKKGCKAEFSICIPKCFIRSSSTGCFSGITYGVIDPMGNVKPCTHSELICGNILNQTIESIWQSKKMKKWREMFLPQCISCSEFYLCHGGCKAMYSLNDSDKDPLMTKPVNNKTTKPGTMNLYEGFIPIANFEIRSESFGYLLLSGNRTIPVSHEAEPVIKSFSQNMTLKQIKENFGQKSLGLIAYLNKIGFISFHDPSK
ncbi:SPASM domain-containing protein, partial [Desulfobacterales bacterium HSG17]|nr:SPASM domain-containing protein [Desulfobacterales bacterium HSG17]